MECLPGHPEVCLIPRTRPATGLRRQHWSRLYRRAVVLRAELQGAALLRPVTYRLEHHEGARYERLRRDLGQAGIVIADGGPPVPDRGNHMTDVQMILELDRALAKLEQKLCPGPPGQSATLFGAFFP